MDDGLHKLNTPQQVEIMRDGVNEMRSMNRNAEGIKEQLEELNNQVLILKEELKEEREKREASEEKAIETEKKNRNIDRWLAFWLAILSAVLTVALPILFRNL